MKDSQGSDVTVNIPKARNPSMFARVQYGPFELSALPHVVPGNETLNNCCTQVTGKLIEFNDTRQAVRRPDCS